MAHISRRSSLLLGLGAIFSDARAVAEPLSKGTPPAPPKPPSAAQSAAQKGPIAPISELLSYATVHLDFAVPGGTRSGTGFAFAFFNQDNTSFPAIISNKHVFGDANTGIFRVTKTKSDNSPDTGNTVTVEMVNLKDNLIRHPDPAVDLAAYPIGPALKELQDRGDKAFLVPMDQTLIPEETIIKSLSAIQQIVSVGYPGQLWDNVNYVPLFHRGYTASPVYLDFQGRKEFAIDIATWPGASGSPVLVLDQGTIFDERTNNIMLGTRIMLLGVAYAVATQEVDGQVVFMQAPIKPAIVPYVSASQIPTNLGLCIKSSRILEFEPLLAKLGVTVPAGYRMRAAG